MIAVARTASRVAASAPTAQVMADGATRIVPFDHSFRFNLRGEPQRVHRTTLTVSVEASFTAVSIGYGVVPEVSPLIFGPDIDDLRGGSSLRDITLGDLMDVLETALANSPDAPKGVPLLEAVLQNGIRLSSAFASVGLLGAGTANLDAATLRQLFQVVGARDLDVQFLYALFDEGSGREFQNEPLLNIAGLGAADGKRPFRYFAQPINFAPRTTIRMDVTELGDFRGELHVSLHGYKALAAPTARLPIGERGRLSRRRSR